MGQQWVYSENNFKEKNFLIFRNSIHYMNSLMVTSMPAEHVFSKAGQLTNLRRHKLLFKNFDKIMFLNSFS